MPNIINAQRDFSAGQPDSAIKRNDESKVLKQGARKMENFRIKNTGGVENRPGRTAKFVGNPAAAAIGRVDEVLMAPGIVYYLVFSANDLSIIDSSGIEVFNDAGSRPWTVATAKNAVWSVYRNSIYITFAGTVPRILTWDGATTWSAANYAEAVTAGGQKRTPFYRISVPGAKMTPAARTGAGIGVTFDQNFLVASHVGTRLRFCGRQVTITGVTNPSTGTITVNETLPGSQLLTFGSDPRSSFALDDEVVGTITNSRGIITASTATTITVQLTSINTSTSDHKQFAFTTTDVVVGPSGSLTPTIAAAIGNPTGAVIWDEEVINSYHGYPASCFVDQNRLGFCNFPVLPSGVCWSAVNNTTDLYPDALPTSAIFELAPDKSQVLYVAAAAESSEFVFCDSAVWYIPISVTNPLKPGSVQFISVSKDGCAQVQPRQTQEFIAYVSNNGNDVYVVMPIGAQTRPYTTRCLTDMHADLFTSIVAIAAPTPDPAVAELYMYALNSDGTIIIGRMTMTDGRLNISDVVGWSPWSGVGNVKWISSRSYNVLMTTNYAPNGITAVPVVEQLDYLQYLDGAMTFIAPPTGMHASQPAGTNIGDMTAFGGLAAAFDGTYAPKASASCAAKFVSPFGYVGRNFTVAQVIGSASLWPSTDFGFVNGSSGNVILDLYGKNGLPANSTDGTLLATKSIANQFTGPVTITPVFSTTTYTHGWVRISRAGGGNIDTLVAQLVMQTGPLWWLAGGTVELMDQTYRDMGAYTINSAGNIVPQNLPGENLLSATLVAGQKWTATLEPWVPPAQGGQDSDQRMQKRRINRAEVHVKNSTGFKMQRLYSGQSGPLLPAVGTVMKTRTISAYVTGDVTTAAPTLREQAYHDNPVGRSHDPRWQIVKDTAGPLIVLDVDIKATV
jgi:hypothetical protein